MDFTLPRYNIIKKGASAALDGILIDLKIKKLLTITDENLVRYCPKHSAILFGKDIDNFLVNLSDFSTYDGIIGVGGGVVLDKARYMSFKLKIPLISFATSLSTDAISSSTIPDSNFVKTPDAVIIDLDIINDSPKRLSVAGYGELMAKIPANLDWKLANKERGEFYDEDISRLASGSAYAMLDFVLNIQENKFNLSGFNQKLSKSLFLSGLSTSLIKNSRPISGSEHLLEKALLKNKNLASQEPCLASLMATSSPQNKNLASQEPCFSASPQNKNLASQEPCFSASPQNKNLASQEPCLASLMATSSPQNKKIKTDALHGEIVGVSTLLFTYLHELENEGVKGITDKLRISYKKIGAPTSFKDLKINFEDALESLLIAHKMTNRYTILRNGLDKNLATDLLKRFY